MATVLDVARRAGVSSATVSRVLNGHPKVGEDARARVLSAAEELAFQPNRFAQGLRRGQSNTVALLVGDIEQNIYSALTRHVQMALDADGLEVMLYNLDHSPARLCAFLDRAPALGLRAIALATTDRLASDAIAPRLLGLQRRGITVISIGQRLDALGIPSIVHEEAAATRRSVAWLLGRGLGPVAYVGRIAGSAIGTERYDGYAAALADAGLAPDPALVVDASYRYAAGTKAVAVLRQAGAPFRSIQAGSDEIALGLMAGLADAGLRVPEDVAVVGFGGLEWAAHVRPALTTHSVDHRATGEALRTMLQGPGVAVHTIERALVVRHSA